MTRLLGLELTRLRWRRAVLLLAAAAVLVPALLWAGTVWETRPYSAEEISQARESARSSPGFDEEVRACTDRPRRFGVDVPPGAQASAVCERTILGWYSDLHRQPLTMDYLLGGSGLGVVVVMAALLALAGATFVGADWTSGSMSNQLLFEPRRWRIYLAKALAIALSALVLALAVQTAWWAGMGLVAAARDVDVAPRVVTEIWQQVLRGSTFVALAALGGYAVTMLFRSTVATLGLLVALVVGATFLIAVLPLDAPERWMPHLNALAWVRGSATYYDPSAMVPCHGREWTPACEGQRVLSFGAAAAYVLGLLTVTVTASLATFLRRDVP